MNISHIDNIKSVMGYHLERNKFQNNDEMLDFFCKTVSDSNLKNTEKTQVVNHIREMITDFLSKGGSWVDYIYSTSNQLLQTMNIDKLPLNKDFVMIPLSDTLWEKVKQYDVTPLHSNDEIAYRGGKARIISKAVLSCDITKDDMTSDSDFFITQVANKDWICNHYNCEPQGVRFLPDLKKETLLKEMGHVDCSLNQCFVTKDSLLISQKCITSLKNKIISPTVIHGKDLYADNFYIKDNIVIYSAKNIRRLIKTLTDGRASQIQIQAHNIQKDNLIKLGFEKDLLSQIRKYTEKNDEKIISMFYKLSQILIELGFINDRNQIFTYFDELLLKYPDFCFINHKDIFIQEKNWLTKKFINLNMDYLMDKGDKSYEYKYNKLSGYDLSDLSVSYVRVDSSFPDDGFLHQYSVFKKDHTGLFV